MAHSLVRGFACLRVCAARASVPSRSVLFSQQTASISYTSDPIAYRRPKEPHPQKIPPSARPIAREPLPPPTITEEELAKRPYVMRRTAYAQLPIYRVWKSGGTRQIILLKKVDGDKQQLVNELKERLGIDQERIRINAVTKHIEIKGDYLPKAIAYLTEQGF